MNTTVPVNIYRSPRDETDIYPGKFDKSNILYGYKEKKGGIYMIPK